MPLSERRKALEKLMKQFSKGSVLALSETLHIAPQELTRVVREFALEGIIAKRKDSLYESGKRSGAWVKYRVNKGQEFVIGGYTQGNPFDAIIVGHYENGNLIYAAKVRNGFVPYRRQELMGRMKLLRTTSGSRHASRSRSISID